MVPEIMIPLVGEVKELKYVKNMVIDTADKIIAESGLDMKYEVGTMIEIPRAALTADEIAKEAEFFSFGTNDLTQMTFGFSRDDAGKFLDATTTRRRLTSTIPFARLDQNGVASWSIPPSSWAGSPVPTCNSASAASTAATPPASNSATASAWTMCPAPPSASPSPASPPRSLPSRTPAMKYGINRQNGMI